MDKNKSIETLQFFTTGLSNGAFVHKVQGQMLKSAGFTKLGEKYISHYDEEMGWVTKFIDRILDLGGEVKVEDRPATQLVADPVEYVKCDLQRQNEGLEVLRKCLAEVCDDPTTYDILKGFSPSSNISSRVSANSLPNKEASLHGNTAPPDLSIHNPNI